MAAKKNRGLYQFKITLRGIRPPIWRRIQIWEDATLAQLHRILQAVMGWEDYHLYEFRIGRTIYGVPDSDDERKIIDAKRTRIHAVLHGVGAEFGYVYDLGDDWQHDLLLEAILQPAPDTTYPRCIAGERSSPPEDVGGVGGYEDYLEALADPEHEQHQEMMEWRGPFNPQAFSVEEINRQLEKKFRSARAKAIPANSRQPRIGNHSGRESASSLWDLLSGPNTPRKEQIRIKPDETIPLELDERERELIERHTLADENLTDRLHVVPKASDPPIFRFTLDDLDELAGFVTAEANHTKDKKLQKELDRLYERIQATLDV